jgi:DNA-directed RNA polymerase subunit RPC12/RpoP
MPSLTAARRFPPLNAGYEPVGRSAPRSYCCPECGRKLSEGYSCPECADRGEYHLAVPTPKKES